MSYKPYANVFDFRYMRATELPFNQRITLPDRVDDATEIKMYSLKQDLKKITDVMKAKVENGNNLSTQQRRGIASLSNRVRESDIVVFKTDKSGRFSVDTPDNYRRAVQPYVGGNPEVSRADHDAIEKLLNAHGVVWTRIISTESRIT